MQLDREDIKIIRRMQHPDRQHLITDADIQKIVSDRKYGLYKKIIKYVEKYLASPQTKIAEQDADSFIASNMSWLSKWIDEAKSCSPLFAAHHLQVSTSYLIPTQSVEKGLVDHIRKILKELIFGDRGFRKKMGRLPVPEDSIKIFFIPQPNRGQGIDGYDKEAFSYSFLTKFMYLVFL